MKPKVEMLYIRLAQDQTYAEILRELGKKIKPEDSETEIQSISRPGLVAFC